MRVIIIGGGEVGTELARRLSPDHDVVIIEQKDDLINKLSNEIDCQVVSGNGASTSVLVSADVRKAGLLIAVTEIDEVNMITCMLAKKFGVQTTVARLRNPEYTDDGKHVLQNELMGIDYIINPERVAAEEIGHYILNPELLDTDYYAGGRVHVSGYRINNTFPLHKMRLQDVKMPPSSIICAIIRGDDVIIPGGKDVILENDEIYVLGKTNKRSSLFWGGRKNSGHKRVIIAGGGRIGFQLAQMLEQSQSLSKIKIIEKNTDRCEKISEELSRTQVYHGDVTDVRFLKNIQIRDADLFIAVTGDDEVNLLSTLLAKKMGAKKTVSEVIRPDYQLILSSIGIDKVVSPRLLTATIIMRLIRKGNIVGMTILREGKAQMMEAIMPAGSSLEGKRIKDAGFPPGILLAAIARGEKILVPDGNERIYASDRFVIFLLPQHTTDLAALFSGKFKHIGSFPALHKLNMENNS
ncbi:Trk system potassium transporter TrkA [Dethiobacter alkaliphilus]|uniref:Trk system potassium transporter TrkA n=1 Tax=Dethiobacter alkaliphilus TaxID=427926 RepID=UPI002226F90D|nr:Trk system potassium transporter TrkA [Dethiobacter alkaliphilus]MCW3489614.1 Trk system potassium transporter TrkA [Dethiobacter alkaliphilus]